MGTFIALAGVQGLSLALLGLNTSLARNKYKVPGTYDTADAKYSGLYAAQRAHGNQRALETKRAPGNAHAQVRT